LLNELTMNYSYMYIIELFMPLLSKTIYIVQFIGGKSLGTILPIMWLVPYTYTEYHLDNNICNCYTKPHMYVATCIHTQHILHTTDVLNKKIWWLSHTIVYVEKPLQFSQHSGDLPWENTFLGTKYTKKFPHKAL